MSFYTIITKVPLVGNRWITPPIPKHPSQSFDFLDWDSVIRLNDSIEPYGNTQYSFVLDTPLFWYDAEVAVLQHLKDIKGIRNNRLYTRIFNTRVLSHPFQPESAVYFGEVFLNGVKYTVSSNRLIYKSAAFGTRKKQFPDKNEVAWDMNVGGLFKQLYDNSKRLHEMVLGSSFSRQHFTIRYLKDNHQIFFSENEIENIVLRRMSDHLLGISDVRKYAGTYIFEGASQFKKELFAVLNAFAKENGLLILVETLTGVILTKIDGREDSAKRSLQEIVQEADAQLNEELAKYLKKEEGKIETSDWHSARSGRAKKKASEFDFLGSLWRGNARR